MSKSNNHRVQKKMIYEKLKSYERFNIWERQVRVKPDSKTCLAAISMLYELMPDETKRVVVDVEDIIKMRKGLECLS